MKTVASAWILLTAVQTGLPASPEEKWPQRVVTNGVVKLTVYLPDAEKGYYRGTRFDWSGMIGQAEYQGHTFFGEWKTPHDPAGPDDGVGPAEEFGINKALGYEDAKVGGSFMKIGVGLLEKPQEPGYRFNHPYKIVKPAPWKVTADDAWIEFQQDFEGEGGWGYRYIKRIELPAADPSFRITHVLKNTGTRRLDTNHYSHNFIIIDREPIGSAYRLRFPFDARASKEALKDVADIRGKELVFRKDLKGTDHLYAEFKGFPKQVQDNAVEIENQRARVMMRIRGDRPLADFHVFAVHTTICPEPYIDIKLAPGEEVRWTTKHTLVADRPAADSRQDQVNAVLDDWHHAAAKADEARYFDHFTADAVFLGTDATERWTRDEFRKWAKPYFAKGKAWSFKAARRHVSFSKEGSVAWFDEDLDTPNLGPARGSGVLVRDGSSWKITQYNLSVPIPNEAFGEVKKIIDKASKAKGTEKGPSP
jgi:hypothetical protein